MKYEDDTVRQQSRGTAGNKTNFWHGDLLIDSDGLRFVATAGPVAGLVAFVLRHTSGSVLGTGHRSDDKISHWDLPFICSAPRGLSGNDSPRR